MNKKIIQLIVFVIWASIIPGICSENPESHALRQTPVFTRFSEVSIACPMGAAPFSYLDEDGQMKGSIIDLWRLWSEKTGINITFIPGVWKDTINTVCTGKADIHAVFNEPNDTCLDLVVPVVDFGITLFWNKIISGTNTVDDLTGIRIGVVRGTVEEAWLKENHPKADLTIFQSVPATVEAARNGEIKAMFIHEEAAVWWLKKYQILSDFQFIPRSPPVKRTYYAAVKKGNTSLAGLVKKGMGLITDDERASAERKWLGESSVKTDDTLIISMNTNIKPLSFLNLEGKPAGFFVDIWKLWAEKTETHVEFIPVNSGKAGRESVKNRNADIFNGFFFQEEHYEGINFSHPFYEAGVKIFVPTGSTELSGQLIGVIRGSPPERYLKQFPKNINVAGFNSREDMMYAAREGIISGFFSLPVLAEADMSRLGLSGRFETLPRELFRGGFRAAVLKENKNLLTTVNNGFDALTDKERAEIEKQWIPDPENRYFEEDTKKIHLSGEEKAWLASHRDIRVGLPPEFPPLRIYTEKGIKGYSIDYLNLISGKTGIRFQYIPLKFGDLDPKIKTGEIDLFLTFNVPERLAFSIFTKPFTEFKPIIITRNDAPFMDSISPLRGKKVAVIKGMGIYNKLVSPYPDIERIEMTSMDALFKAVSESRAYATFSAPLFAGYLMRNYPNLKIAGVAAYSPEPYMYAVRKDYPELVGIINKAIDSVTREEHDAIFEKWCGVQLEYRANWSEILEWVYTAGAFVVILFAISLLWNRRLVGEITERRQAEDALKRSHERFVTVMDSIQALIYVADMNTYEILFINQYTRSLFGNIEGRICWQSLQKDQTGPCPFCTNKYLTDNGKPAGVHKWEFQNSINGRWYHIQNQAIRWIDGRLVRLEVATDISKLKQTEAELTLAKETADKATRAKSTFLANMSHELRTPLNSILGFSQVLERSPNLNHREHKNLMLIRRSGEHLLGLINDVLEISKIEAGRTVLNKKDLDLYQLLDDVEAFFFQKAGEKGLKLVFECDPGVPRYIHTDEGKLRQILINLTGNAVKFTRTGEIRLSVSSESSFQQAEGPETDKCLLFTVKDTGKGIAPHELEMLFDAFVQTETGRESGEGTGLGLSISRKFVRMMGGDIRVESDVGKGSVFRFGIRAGIADGENIRSSQPKRHVAALAPGQPEYRILIADDSEPNRLLLAELLALPGVELREAENGREAVEIWKEWEPHLIFMDIRMPVMDGSEAARTIRSSMTRNPKPEIRNPVIIAVTASLFDKKQVAGCDDIIRKPFKDVEIFDAIQRHLEVRFVYEDTPKAGKTETGAETAAMTGEGLTALPPDLPAGLKQAAIDGDSDKLLRTIADIRLHDAALAEELTRLTDDFAFDTILDMIRKHLQEG